MIDFTATDPDGYTITVYSGNYPLSNGTQEGLGTRTRVVVGDPDGDYICCDLTATRQARLAAALTDGDRHQPHDK